MISVERGTILRGFFSLLTMHTWYCGMFDPLTLHYMVTQGAGWVGLGVITLFGLLGMLALVDTVVNDVMSKKFFLNVLLGRRHLVFMNIALLNATELFVSVQYVFSWGLALYCFLVCSFVVLTAFRDIHYRYPDDKHA
jgi:hypothetical protein